MRTFAFIGHYLGLNHFRQLIGWPASCLNVIPSNWTKRIIQVWPPFMYLEMPPLESTSGEKVRGINIIASFLPEHIVTLGEEAVLDKIVSAAHLAERLGADIVGLAGFASIVGNEGEELSKRTTLPVTSGNTFTAALAISGLKKAAQLLDISLSESTLAVIGATGDIGSICTRILAKSVGQVHVAARNEKRLESFASQIQQESGKPVHVFKYISDAVRGADLVLTATSALTTLINLESIKPGCIVCDVALPHNVGIDLMKSRPDVFVFEGGLARLPKSYSNINQRWLKLSPDGRTIFGCMAETIVLALAGRLECFSLGRGNITPEKVYEIESLALHHGFDLADFRCGDKVWNVQSTDEVRKSIRKRIVHS